jgi:hypothetical protein
MQISKPQWSVWIVAGIVLVVIGIQLALSLKQNGHFVYALDDPYIHMAIARNFARYGVWGVTRYEFSSSTSSLLWTLLLVPAYRFTSSPYVPLILNILCAIGVLLVADRFLQQSQLRTFPRLSLLLFVALLTPLTSLVFSGMEHTGHVALSLALTYVAAKELAAPAANTPRLLLLLAALTPLMRYEGLFLVGVIAVLFAVKRRYITAALVVLVAVAPLGLYGWYSWMHGSFLLPNPVLLKGSTPRTGFLPFLVTAGNAFLDARYLICLCLLAIWLVWLGLERTRQYYVLLIFIFTTALHMLFARVGWFYRYDAYLVTIGVVIAGGASLEFILRYKNTLAAFIAQVLFGAAFVFLVIRAGNAIHDTVPAMRNVYEQQYQMAIFLRDYYSGAGVAANDIGAINFMADIRCLDLLGLGSAEVTRDKLMGRYNTARIEQLAREHQVKIAMIYEGWYDKEGGVPPSWIKVGDWNIHSCVVCGAPVVTFYAVDPNETENLRRNLREFSKQLPTNVTATFE